MKSGILVVFCSILMLLGCSSTQSTSNVTPTSPKPTAKKGSVYAGVSATKVKSCMGDPASTFTANNNTYWRYFIPNHCEVLFIVNDNTQKVVDVKYLFPHAFTRYGYAVDERKCPLAQKECLLS